MTLFFFAGAGHDIATTPRPASLATLYLSHLSPPNPTAASRRATARPCSAFCFVPPSEQRSKHGSRAVGASPRHLSSESWFFLHDRPPASARAPRVATPVTSHPAATAASTLSLGHGIVTHSSVATRSPSIRAQVQTSIRAQVQTPLS